VNKIAKNGRWLVRLELVELISAMMIYSEHYKLAWADSWGEHLDDPDWLRRAMGSTFARLTAADKELIRPAYEDWQWLDKTFDMKYLVCPQFNALCWLLDGSGKRVCRMDGAVTVLVGLKGQDRREAMQGLDVKRYEFCSWW